MKSMNSLTSKKKTKSIYVPSSREELIKFMESIPEEQWYSGKEFQSNDGKQKCFFGHLGLFSSMEGYLEKYSKGKIALFHFLNDNYPQFCEMAKVPSIFSDKITEIPCPMQFPLINDGKHPDFQQPTSKQRILAALNTSQSRYSPFSDSIEYHRSIGGA